MNPGKEICKELKELRKQIAEENGIHLEMEECKFKGKCDGICPRCDAEVRYLEGALADRIRMGKVAVVAGLALGLSATTSLAAESGTVSFSGVQPVVKELVLPTDSVRITGRVVDSLTGKGREFANIKVLYNDSIVAVAVTDSNGNYFVQAPVGIYDIRITFVGCQPLVINNCNCEKSIFELGTVKLECNSPMMGLVRVVKQEPRLGGKEKKSRRK